MLVNIIQNTISSFRSALAAAEVITTNLKMWLGFETSETLGTEEVVNGDFATDLSNWSIANSDSTHTVTHTSNGARFKSDTTSPLLTFTSDTANIVSGRSYEIKVVISEYQGSSGIKIQNSATGNVNYLFDSVDTFTYSFTAVSNSSNPIQFYRNGANVDITIESVSLKELTQITPDKSGNNNVGELFTGKALDFNGSTDYVDIDGFQMTGTNATFAFWFNSNDTLGRFFDTVKDLSDNRLILSFNNNQISILDDSLTWFNFGSVTTNVWNRCVITINGTTAKCFVNGVQLGVDKTISTIDLSLNTDAAIGSHVFGTQSYFDGSLSDFQIYNSVWVADDIAYDYANPNKLAIDNPSTSLSVTNLKGYWALSEGDGLVAYDSGTNLEEEEVVDGDFSSSVNWADSGNQWVINNDTATYTGDGSSNELLQEISFIGGKTYEIKIDVASISGTLKVRFNNDQTNKVVFNETGVQTLYITASSTGTIPNDLSISRELGTVSAVLNSVSVREITASDHGGIVNGATYVDAQPRIPQLGMMNWAKSTPVSDEITLIPNPTIPTQDIFGNAVRDRLNSFNLDGSGYAEVADDDSINPTTEITVQCWIQSNTESDRGLVAKWKNPSPKDYMLYKLESNFRFYIGGNFGTSDTIPTSGWVNIAGTYDGSNIKTYINGTLSTTTALTGLIPNNSNTLDIGRYNEVNGTPYSERISDVLLYDIALDAEEIENNYNAGLSAHTN